MEQLPFADTVFDVVFVANATQYTADRMPIKIICTPLRNGRPIVILAKQDCRDPQNDAHRIDPTILPTQDNFAQTSAQPVKLAAAHSGSKSSPALGASISKDVSGSRATF